MVRSFVLGFGAATVLAAAASMTPVGQGILGVNHAGAAPATAAVVRHAKPSAKHVVPAKPSPRASSHAHRAAVARRPQAAPASRPAPGTRAPSGMALNLNQLLPLLLQSQSFPSLLSQTTPAASPLAGIMGGGSSFPDILQQLTDPVATPDQASAPQPVQAPTSAAPALPQSAQGSGEQWVPENRH